jgi:catecholate siderophore receptor
MRAAIAATFTERPAGKGKRNTVINTVQHNHTNKVASHLRLFARFFVPTAESQPSTDQIHTIGERSMAYIRSRKHALPSTSSMPRLTACSAAIALAALAIPPAHAQTPPSAPSTPQTQTSKEKELPEVKVKSTAESLKPETLSSPKYTQPLIDTPQTITVIKKEVLQQQGAVTLSEALRNTPGITIQLGENGNTATGDAIFMRGFDSQGNIYVDGIRDLGTVSRDVFNIEQVEVVKGASGSENGRGTASGYVNLSSKVPLNEDFSAGIVAFGTDDQKRVTADLNRKIGTNSAVRINLLRQDNGVPGRDQLKRESTAIAPSIAFGLGTPTRIYLYSLHMDQENKLDGGLPTIGLPGFYNPAFATGGVAAGQNPGRVDRENYYGADGDKEDVQGNMFTARIEHDVMPDVTVRNTARYGKNKQKYVVTGVNALTIGGANPDTWTVARSRQGKEQINELVTNQTNVTARIKQGGMTHAISGGVEFIYERQYAPTYAVVGTQANANVYNPRTSDVFMPVLPNGASAEGKTTTIGAYLFDTLEVGTQWLFTAGLRADKYNTKFTSITANTATPPSVGTSLEDSDTLLSTKLAAVFKPAANGSVYAAIGTSELPPGGTNFQLNATNTNINNPNLDPQKATNVELGTKWDVFKNQLAVSAVVFRTENKNDLAQVDAVTGEVTQFGKRRIHGIELAASGQLSPVWFLNAGLSKVKAKVSQGTATQSGAAIQQTPETTFTLWSTYKLPMGLTFGGGARFVDSLVRQVNNAPAANTNGVFGIEEYWVFDAMASYEINKNTTLQLNVYNLADKFYAASLNNGGSRFIPGAPRSALLTLGVRF